MSNHNYSQYSSKKSKAKEPTSEVKMEVETPEAVEVVEAVTPAPVSEVVETVETMTPPKSVIGTVANCLKLNIRVKPAVTADAMCVVDMNSKLTIDPANSSDEWLAVTTVNGDKGFCMKKFVNAKL